jgi:uroporphyrinogen-III synthase
MEGRRLFALSMLVKQMGKATTILSTKIIQASLKKRMLKKNIVLADYTFIDTVDTDDSVLVKAVMCNQAHYIFTSKRAVELVTDALEEQHIKMEASATVYCLTGETQKAVQAAGMHPMLAATSVRQLAQMIIKKGKSKKLLFFSAGSSRNNELPELLKGANIQVQEVAVYKTVLTPCMILHNYKAVLFFSPGAVQSFCMNNKLPENTPCICIGSATVRAVKGNILNANIYIADKPTQQDVVYKAAEILIANKTIAIT